VAVDDAAGRDERHVHGRPDLLQQGEQVRRAHATQAAALGAFDDQPVGAGIDRPLGVGDAADLVVQQHAGVPCPRRDRRRIADARDQQPRAPVEDPVEDLLDATLALQHPQEHLQPERVVGHRAGLVVLGRRLGEPGCVRRHQPHPTGCRHRAGELGPGEVPDRGVEDRVLTPRRLDDPVALERVAHEPAMVGGRVRRGASGRTIPTKGRGSRGERA
jgi:hypothetical protein